MCYTKIKKETMHRFLVEVEYADGTNFNFNVELEGIECHVVASLMQITRGTLMASSAYKATAYRSDGFPICSYINR